jgi:hypothetical protein
MNIQVHFIFILAIFYKKLNIMLLIRIIIFKIKIRKILIHR